MKFFVKTTGQRELHKSFNQIKYTFLWDKKHHVGKAFFRWLKQMKKQDCVVLEDDIILCDHFEERINAAIQTCPNNLTNFFADYKQWQPCHWKQEWNNTQCVYYPKEISRKIYKFYKKYPIYKLFSKHSPLLSLTMSLMNMQHWVYFPCLVQHLDLDSLIYSSDAINGYRRTEYFIDDLQNLGAVNNVQEYNILSVPITIDSFNLLQIVKQEQAYNQQKIDEYNQQLESFAEKQEANKHKKEFVKQLLKQNNQLVEPEKPSLLNLENILKEKLHTQAQSRIDSLTEEDFIHN